MKNQPRIKHRNETPEKKRQEVVVSIANIAPEIKVRVRNRHRVVLELDERSDRAIKYIMATQGYKWKAEMTRDAIRVFATICKKMDQGYDDVYVVNSKTGEKVQITL